MSNSLLLYGAYGYTGRLIAEHAVAQGMAPVLAGRNREKVAAEAEALGLDARVFPLDDPAGVAAALDGIHCVIHAAGPFSATARPMMTACLRSGTHYLDITGEIDVFELAAGLDEEAKGANAMLLPGVGFDVVPSDCLAAYVAAQTTDPVHLRLGILGLGRASQGTAKTMMEMVDAPTKVRREGTIVTRPAGSLTRTFDFGRGPRRTVAVSWGDVATAYYSTGVPNVTVYFPAKGMSGLLRLSRIAGPLLATRPVQALLKKLVELQPAGPDAQTLEEGTSIVVAEVEDAHGTIHQARLLAPNGYKLTYIAAVDIARRVLAGDWQAGFQTPSLAYGADYVFTLPGCRLASD